MKKRKNIKISKNVHCSTAECNPKNRPIVRPAPSWEGDYYYIPSNRFSKANELMSRNLIRIED